MPGQEDGLARSLETPEIRCYGWIPDICTDRSNESSVLVCEEHGASDLG